MAGRFAHPKFQAIVAGVALAGAKLYVYQNGTTTKTNSYTDRAAGTPNANPVICDANGEADVWLPPGVQYTLKLDNSADVQQWSVDDISTNDLSTWVISGSDVYYSAGNVYVGASSGTETLDVTGTFAVSSTSTLTGAVTMSSTLTIEAAIKLGTGAGVTSTTDTDSTDVFGGTGATSPNLKLYGAAHATKASKIELYHASTARLDYVFNGAATHTIVDNVSGALAVTDGTDEYFNITTTNSSEAITLGNSNTNPSLTKAGTGEVFLNLPVSAGTSGSLWNDSGTVKVA